MTQIKCPFCGSQEFFLKDPEDEYETYEFQTTSGEVAFPEGDDVSEHPEMTDDSETYCCICAWHGKFQELKKQSGR